VPQTAQSNNRASALRAAPLLDSRARRLIAAEILCRLATR
jgi:hypothetical protein